jgi:hypothetical protein
VLLLFFVKSSLILIIELFFFALTKQLNSNIVVQYYMSEASFRIADLVKMKVDWGEGG